MEGIVAQIDKIIDTYESELTKLQDRIFSLNGVLKQLKNLKSAVLDDHSIPLVNGITSNGGDLAPSRVIPSVSRSIHSRLVENEPQAKPKTSTIYYNSIAPKSPVNSIQSEPKVEESGYDGYMKVKMNEFIDVSLAFVWSSRNFVIQPDYDKIEEFYKSMNEYYYSIKSNTPLTASQMKPNDIVCLYDADTESYCRAKFVSREGDKAFKAYFLDFGSFATSSIDNFYKLESKFAQEPIMALQCHFEGYWTENVSKLDAILLEAVSSKDKTVQAKFEKPIGKSFPVELKIDGQDVKSIRFSGEIPKQITQIQFDFITFFTDKNIKVTNDILNYFKVVSKHYDYSQISEFSDPISVRVNDPSHFVVTFDKSGSTGHDLNNFVTNLSSFYSFCNATSDIRSEELIVFKYQTFFFRGLVLEKIGSTDVSVFSVDLGFSITVPTSHVFDLIESFKLHKVAPLSILCGVHRLIPFKGTNWSQFAISFFKNYAKDSFCIEKKAYADGKFWVEVSGGNKDIIAALKKQKFAKDSEE